MSNDDFNYDNIDKDELNIQCRKPDGELGVKVLQRMVEDHESYISWAVTNIQINEDDVVLDVGCGAGRNIERFAQMTNSKVYGVDYSKTSVSESIKRNQDLVDEGRVEVVLGEVSNLPFEDNIFDWVTGFSTIFFWPDLVNDIKEIHRVLKPNGHIFICNGIDKDNLPDDFNMSDFEGMNLLSGDDYLELYEKAGFTDVQLFRNKEKHILGAVGKK